MDQVQRVRRLTVDSKYLRKVLWGKFDSTRTKILKAKILSFPSRYSSLYTNAEQKEHNQIQVTVQGTSIDSTVVQVTEQGTSYRTGYKLQSGYKVHNRVLDPQDLLNC